MYEVPSPVVDVARHNLPWPLARAAQNKSIIRWGYFLASIMNLSSFTKPVIRT
jgi:hypothetical protein